MENLLVTGGAGFIGSNFVRHLLSKGSKISLVNLDALTYAGNLENLADLPNASDHHFVHGDIRDYDLVTKLLVDFSIDTIINFAAESHVDRSIYAPDAFIQTNIIGTYTLLKAATQVWKDNFEGKRFHHISTDEVYGELSLEDPPFSERTPYSPRSPYSASKASSDHLVRAWHHTYSLPITISNCTNNYGPHQFPEKLIPLMILNALKGKPLPIYGKGQQIRNWLYVVDHCEAIIQILKKGENGQTYCIGGDNQYTNMQVVSMLCKILDELMPDSPNRPHSKLITNVKDRPGHDYRYDMDNTSITQSLGWTPTETLETGLQKTAKWYLSNLNWVSSITGKEDFDQWIQQNYTNREVQ
jgi:dTDP-glucose 4,6-dehydratase